MTNKQPVALLDRVLLDADGVPYGRQSNYGYNDGGNRVRAIPLPHKYRRRPLTDLCMCWRVRSGLLHVRRTISDEDDVDNGGDDQS